MMIKHRLSLSYAHRRVWLHLFLEIGAAYSNLFVLLLVLVLHDLLLLFVLNVFDLISEQLHFLQSEVDLLTQLITKVFVHWSFLVIE